MKDLSILSAYKKTKLANVTTPETGNFSIYVNYYFLVKDDCIFVKKRGTSILGNSDKRVLEHLVNESPESFAGFKILCLPFVALKI